MTGRPPRDAGPFGPLGRLDEVQRQAFDAALRIAGEFSSAGGGLAESSLFGLQKGNGSSNGAGDDAPLDVGRLRSDVMRAADTLTELLHALIDVGFDAMDEATRRAASRPAAHSRPGETTTISIQIGNTKRRHIANVSPWLSDLTSDDGTVLDAVTVARPDRLELAPHERAKVSIQVEVGPGARPGTYHGLVLASGLSDLAEPVQVIIDELDDGGVGVDT